jgi:hypothetical protein
MTDRDVWILAGEVLAEHGEMTFEYIMGQLSQVLEDTVATENWRRVAGAVDAIAAASLQ